MGSIGGTLFDQRGEGGAGGGEAAGGDPELGAENGELGAGLFAVSEDALETVECGFAACGVAGAEEAFDGVQGGGGGKRAAIDVNGAEALVEAATKAWRGLRSANQTASSWSRLAFLDNAGRLAAASSWTRTVAERL